MIENSKNPQALARRKSLVLATYSAGAIALDFGISRLTFGAVLPAITRDFQLSYTEAGLLNTSNLAAYLLGILLVPLLARRWSLRALALYGHAVVAVSTLFSAFAPDPLSFGLARLFMGLGTGVGLIPLLTVLFEHSAPARRFAISAFVWSGIGIAPVLTGLALPHLLNEVDNWRIAFLTAGAIGGFLVILLAFALPDTAGRPGATATNQSFGFRKRRPGLWLPIFGAYLMYGMGYVAYSTFAGVRLHDAGTSVAAMSMSWIFLGLAAVAGNIVTASLLSRPSIKQIALIAAILCGVPGSWLLSQGLEILPVISVVLVGLGLTSTPAIVSAYIRDRSNDVDYASLFGTATAIGGVGQLLSPAIAGVFIDHFGTAAISAFAGCIYGLGVCLAVLDRFVARGPHT